ncbi:MAG TPA: hypothetical protein P5136_00170 [Methanofastidiosum sp.]|nr:hypothetical protein [Methanofastidiosum sp.]
MMKKSLPKEVNTNEIVNIFYEKTVKWGKKYGLVPRGEKPEKDKYSSRAKKFSELLTKADLGCKDAYIRELVEELAGEKLPPKKNSNITFEYEHGLVVVPLSDPHGKGLPISEPVLVKDTNGTFIAADGTQTKQLPKSPANATIRLASRSEVESLLESLMNLDSSAVLLSAFFMGKIGG